MRNAGIILRPSERRDAEAIAAIYAPIVQHTAISFETEPPSAHAMAERIESTQRQYPWLVAVAGDAVAGYAYASEHRQRAAYRWSVDVAIYIAEAARCQGVGRRLYGALIPMLRAQHYCAAFAGITLPNDASVGLHEALGFKALGIYTNVGFKLGAWHDVGWWQLDLTENRAPPSEPLSFPQLCRTSGFSDFLK